jgi:hypothetical protein
MDSINLVESQFFFFIYWVQKVPYVKVLEIWTVSDIMESLWIKMMFPNPD